MKRWLASLLLLAACGEPATSFPPGPAPATAAAIPEGRTPQERRELFQAAITLYDRGDRAAAEPLFGRVAEAYPELADYGLRYLAKIAEVRGDAGRAATTWQALRDRFPDSVWQGEAHLGLARALASANDWHAASGELAAARSALKDSVERAMALGLALDAARQLSDASEAHALATELRSRYPRSPEAAQAREAAWADKETALVDARTAREEISLLLTEGQPSRALELARLAQARFRSETDLPELLWLEASALAKTGERTEADAVLERLRARYPRHPAAAQALYRQASAAWNRDDDEAALDLFARYLREYPHGAQAAESLYASGRIHQEARRFDSAAREFARLVRLYPKSTLASEARFRVAWCEYRAGEADRAARSFQQIADLGTDERPAALYWKARAKDDASAYEAVLREYPESYYAAFAEHRLGRREGSALAEHPPPGTTAVTAPVAAACGGGGSHLPRFVELKSMALMVLARGELAAYQELVSGCDEFLIQAWVEVGGYRQSVGRALHAGGCGLDSPWLRYCYPLAYWPLIQRHTAERAIDPYLTAALIRQESLFDAEARSSANAIGLMQIIPTTGERLASRYGVGDFHTDKLADPAANVALGTAYLRELLDRYGGNIPRALAAYNAGEAAVDKWQRRYPDVEDDEFVESISYRETRGYVKRVLQNRRVYETLYPRPEPPRPASRTVD